MGNLLGPPVSERVIAEIIAERRRQIVCEGFSHEHDDLHASGEIAAAAGCYALQAAGCELRGRDIGRFWPWSASCWKPKDQRQDLIRAAALLVAELERIDRAASNS